MITYGSLCSGYEGIGLGLSYVVPIVNKWNADNDPGASKILAAHFPDVPNLGDITNVDWTTVEPVDLLAAGYPCQPFSHAGKRKGLNDERHIWPHIAAAIGVLRPGRVLLENVPGHISLGFDSVLAHLAALRYDTTWVVVRAADVGATHLRGRLFILATDTDNERGNGTGLHRSREWWRPQSPHGSLVVANPDEPRPQGSESAPGQDLLARCGRAPADADSDGQPQLGWQQPVERDADRCSYQDVAWGDYEPAIRRWERVTGRPSPLPRERGPKGDRLSPVFSEWMMGLRRGWVTDVELTREQKHHAIGNGVVPQQCALAVRALLEIESREAVAQCTS